MKLSDLALVEALRNRRTNFKKALAAIADPEARQYHSFLLSITPKTGGSGTFHLPDFPIDPEVYVSALEKEISQLTAQIKSLGVTDTEE